MDGSLRVTFLLPALNETYSLRQTAEEILELAGADVREVLILIADRTTEDCLEVVENLRRRHPDMVRVHKQHLPFLGGALREGFDLAAGDHVMLMSSDLETEPKRVPAFLRTMREGRWDIVAGSRWIEGGGFSGYDPRKLWLNYLFQKMFQALYGARLTDLTFAYRLYRKEVLEGVVWSELKHPFLLECLLKPLRRGARVTEIPCQWRARTEGESASTFLETFRYLRTAVTTRFLPRESFMKR